LGKRIRDLRKARNWTQEDLAGATGFDLSYIGGLEVGRRNPTLRTLVIVAKGLKVPVRDLFEF
jgi:transcriptional regulator with XRE-family HTH domain